ncbi:ejaculatory bulb-specific protein 3 [Aethina tumida]|uniref:ejaculatory bulb-specific protein 3 n=1 Tax=Aethina tumida TaxID=116153 RepID=UPI0021492F58|nr:ejaculatory bulb-specific protein 3 [Aethina tumida]
MLFDADVSATQFSVCANADDQVPQLNLDLILQNDRLLTSYANCLLDKGKCSASGLSLKKRLPEAIKTGCGDCSKEEKEYAKQIVKFLVKNKKPMLEEILKKYDPNGTYKAKYQHILEN